MADEETKQRRYERTVGTITLIATLAAAGFAGGAYVQAKRQADIAQEALIESDHPFLEVRAKSNADVTRKGEQYASIELTLTNRGSKPLVLERAEFATAVDQTMDDTLRKAARPGVITLDGACTHQLRHKIIPEGDSVSLDCQSKVSRKELVDDPYVVGTIIYGGQLGTRWRQIPLLVHTRGAGWLDQETNGLIETRIGAGDFEVPRRRYGYE